MSTDGPRRLTRLPHRTPAQRRPLPQEVLPTGVADSGDMGRRVAGERRRQGLSREATITVRGCRPATSCTRPPGLTHRLEPILLAVTAAALTSGGIAWLADAPSLADLSWALGTMAAVVPAVWWVLAALRRGQAGADLIAVLALGGRGRVPHFVGPVLFPSRTCLSRR